MKMKQRSRAMPAGDELIAHDMGNKKNEDDPSEIQLYKIKPQDHFIEAQVQEGDTLQAIALRFYCSISELKRINYIHKDNEIFARRTIKVPVTPYSVLTELIPMQQNEPIASTSNHTSKSHIQDLIQNGIPKTHATRQKEDIDLAIDCNSIVMNSTVAPSVTPYTDLDTADQPSEDTQLLPNKERTSVESVVVKELTTHGADFGLKWFHLVCFVLILGVIAPLVYVVWFLKPEHEDHIKVTSTLKPHRELTDDLPPLQTL